MPSRTLTVKQLFFKYILRIVTAYVFWCSLYYIVVEGAFRPNFSLSACKTLVFNVMTKPYSHLWFMPVIAGMYILLPILRQLAANRCTLLYFLAVTFFFSSICQPFFLHEKLTILANTATQWGPDVSIWLFYPMAGYYLATEDFSAKARKILYALGIAGLAVTILGTQWQSVLEGAPNGAFMSYDYPNVALAAGAVFVFIRYAWKQRDTVNFASKTVAFIAKYSFGAYLVHEFFNVILESRGIVAWELGALWATPFLTLGIAVASLAVSWLISKIPVIYRYIG